MWYEFVVGLCIELLFTILGALIRPWRAKNAMNIIYKMTHEHHVPNWYQCCSTICTSTRPTDRYKRTHTLTHTRNRTVPRIKAKICSRRLNMYLLDIITVILIPFKTFSSHEERKKDLCIYEKEEEKINFLNIVTRIRWLFGRETWAEKKKINEPDSTTTSMKLATTTIMSKEWSWK